MTDNSDIVAWWSGGVTSAVACKMAIERFGRVRLVYIETGSHHEDSNRFKADCEAWYCQPIEVIQNEKYTDHFDVIERSRYINGPSGARCTGDLKRHVRERWQRGQSIVAYVWGFESGAKEEARAERLSASMPNLEHHFPLIDAGVDKAKAKQIIRSAGIALPAMYELGFDNNNCVGCVKGGMAYWNKIREHFPDQFNRMATLERSIGRSCLRRYFLDELPLDAGRGAPPRFWIAAQRANIARRN